MSATGEFNQIAHTNRLKNLPEKAKVFTRFDNNRQLQNTGGLPSKRQHWAVQ